MIEKKTVLIIGAGASMPFRLPSGQGLRDLVLRAKGKDWMHKCITGVGLEPREFELFANELSTSGYGSVDAFLEDRPKWTPYGKAAMARCLIDLERDAILFPPGTPKDHWLQVLWQSMSASTWAEFKQNNLKIVSFNYDRLVERYLAKVVWNHYQVSMKEFLALGMVNHVHGSLGRMDVEGQPQGDRSIRRAMKAIQIVHEASTSTALKKANRDLRAAQNILFLGFGFHPKNMTKIHLPEDLGNPGQGLRIVTGTSKGLTHLQWKQVCHKHRFRTWEGSPKKVVSLSQLLRENLR